MKQDEFERLAKILNEMDADAKTKADKGMIESIRIGAGILERFVVAVEIAANSGSKQWVWPPFEHPAMRKT